MPISLQSSESSPFWETIRWWELRRIPYNLLLLVVGIVVIVGTIFIGGSAVKPGEDFVEPMAIFVGVPIFAVLANICYCFGEIVELLFIKPAKGDVAKYRDRAYIIGLSFSIFVTCLPLFWSIFYFVFAADWGKNLQP
jgi:hypothetical protein